MAQFVLINPVGTRYAGEVLDTVQDGQDVITQLASFGGVLVPLPNALLEPYIARCEQLRVVGNNDEATAMMQAAYASSTAIAGGGTAGKVPLWTGVANLGDSVLTQVGTKIGVNVPAPTASLSLPAGLVTEASMNVASGVAPAAPNAGDLWFDGTYLYLRAAGTNQPLNAPFGTGTANTLTMWSGTSGLVNTAITQVAGSILSLTGLVGGAGYASTSTAIVALGSGSGTGATAQIVTSGGAVTWVALKDPGRGYTAGDVLTIPGGSGTITVLAIVPKNDASGHFTAQRIGAGTTQPTAGVDSRDGLQVSGSQVKNVEVFSTLAPVTINAVNSTEFYGTVPFGNSFYAHLVNVAASATGFAAGGLIQSWGSWTNISASSGANSLLCIGVNAQAGRSYAADQNTNVNLTGGTFSSVLRNANAYTTNIMRGVTGGVSSFSSATGTVSGRAVGGDFSANFTTPVTVADLRVIDAALTLSGSAAATIAYMLRLQSATFTAPSVAPTTYWGISQEDTLAKSRFYGNVGVGNALDVGAGKVIGSLTLTNAGAGATNGTYSQVALTGGSGTGATADIVVAGNVVTVLTLRNPGQGYAVGNTLSTAAIGGAGFVFTVASTASILRSDGTSVAPRVGAGNTAPVSTLHVSGGAATLDGFDRVSIPQASTSVPYGNYGVQLHQTGSTALTNANPFQYAQWISSSFDASGATTATSMSGIFASPLVAGTNNTASYSATGVYGQILRYAANDTAQAAGFTGTGGSFQFRVDTGVGSTTTSSGIGVWARVTNSAAAHTITNSYVFYGLATATGNHTTLIGYRFAPVTGAGTITTFYGLRLEATTAPTITNRWAISQEDPLAKSRHYENVGVGNGLDVGAGKVIGSLTLTNGGTGYTNGTYSQVALTTVTGTGSGATADIVVAGGIVTTVALRAPGQGYAVGDTLSCASIGAGSNFLVTVATTASILRSDGTSVAARIGGGTTTPRASADIVGGSIFDGIGTFTFANSGFDNLGQLYASMYVGSLSTTITPTINSLTTGMMVQGVYNLTNVTTSGVQAIRAIPIVTTSTAGGSHNVSGFSSTIYRREPGDLATAATITAYTASIGVNSAAVGSTSTGALTAFNVFLNNGLSTHTIATTTGVDLQPTFTGTTTTFYGFRLRSGSGTGTIGTYYGMRLESVVSGAITTRWGISQEDTAANNVLAGKTAAGQAAGTAATAFVDVGSGGATNAQLRLRTTGGTAPSAPNDGDIWFDGTALKIRIAGVTRTVTVT